MPRCDHCGLILTLIMDHIRKITHHSCPICDCEDGVEE